MNVCCNNARFYKRLSILSFVVMLWYSSVHGQAIGENRFYTLSDKSFSITVDAGEGSRVTSLTFKGKELLHTEPYNNNFGSALRLSPQGKWKQADKINLLTYKARLHGNELHLASTPDTILGFTFSNHFVLDPADTSIKITYSITNNRNQPQTVAPWEVTRVPTGGLAFFPKGLVNDVPLTNKIRPLMNIEEQGGIIWYPYDSSQLAAQKLMMKGSEGWLAYVEQGVIYIRQFPVISDAETAPDEKNVELWVNKEKTFIELENQGPYQQLGKNELLQYPVTWIVRTLPSNIAAIAGNPQLVKFVRTVLRKRNHR